MLSSTEARSHPEERKIPGIEVMFVFGNNIKFGWGKEAIVKEPSHLSPYSFIVIETAAFLWKPGMILYLLTGDTAGLTAESHHMYDMARKRHPHIPKQAFVLDYTSYDTRSNIHVGMQGLPHVIPSESEEKPITTAILSIRGHAQNASVMYQKEMQRNPTFASFAVPKVLVAEDIFSTISPAHAEYIGKLQRSPLYKLEMFKEQVVRRTMIRWNAEHFLSPFAARLRR